MPTCQKLFFFTIPFWWRAEPNGWISRSQSISMQILLLLSGVVTVMIQKRWVLVEKSWQSCQILKSDSSDFSGWSGDFSDQENSSDNTIRFFFPMNPSLASGQSENEQKPHTIHTRYLDTSMISTTTILQKFRGMVSLFMWFFHIFWKKSMNKKYEKFEHSL